MRTSPARDIVLAGEGSRFVLVTRAAKAEVALALPGRHNVRNALAAAAVGHVLGRPGHDRRRPGRCAHGRGPPAGAPPAQRRAMLVDDSYNANPGSMAAAIEAPWRGHR